MRPRLSLCRAIHGNVNPSKPLESADAGAEPVRVSAQPVLGVPLALTDYERTLDWIDETVARHARGYICVAAVHTVMAFQEDPELPSARCSTRTSPCPTASRSCGR